LLAVVLIGSMFPFYWSFLIGSGDSSTIYDQNMSWWPGGNFLAEKQTAKRMRTEFYYPKVSNRMNYAGWEQAGRKDTWTLAEEAARRILENHTPDSIPEETDKKIKEMEPGIK